MRCILCRLATTENEGQIHKADELSGAAKRSLIYEAIARFARQEIPVSPGNQKGVFSSKLLVG
ncbi:hypothetical protein EAG75_16120 [Pseudomonas protegens]|nr:hypothetical protein C1633_26110 [Pseudomonas protegens]RLO22620.1 hypothetical protein EAG75_16120 [Pseudomonas protegens]